MVAPTKIIAGLGLSLGIDILEAPGATGDYRTLLTSKATAIARALSAPLESCPCVFVPGEDDHKPGPAGGYDFGFLHIKVMDTFSLSLPPPLSKSINPLSLQHFRNTCMFTCVKHHQTSLIQIIG